MNPRIVSEKSPVVLVGGGALALNVLQAALQEGAPVVAADGGARPLLDLGHMPPILKPFFVVSPPIR